MSLLAGEMCYTERTTKKVQRKTQTKKEDTTTTLSDSILAVQAIYYLPALFIDQINDLTI